MKRPTQLISLALSLCTSAILLGCTSATSTPPAPVPTAAPIAVTPTQSAPQSIPFTQQATINQARIKIAVAASPLQQQIGLMNRTHLPDDEGMLFPFTPARPVAFWMKNTLIPLDMLYIRDRVIREIKPNVPPCKADPCPSYPSEQLIDNVLELRGGLAEKLGIKVGDRVTLAPLSPNN
ncbi:MAG: hypothetical protein RLZZ511_2911 [Cyanobacteriota bacterium]